MKILGVDPGSTRIGYGLIRVEGGRLHCEHYGLLDLAQVDPERRLLELHRRLGRILDAHQPDQLALERLFFFKNKRTALSVSEARGVIRLLALERKIETVEYTPTQVKQAVSTHGTARKEEVQKMVRIILGLTETPQPDDVADALALAICASQKRGY